MSSLYSCEQVAHQAAEVLEILRLFHVSLNLSLMPTRETSILGQKLGFTRPS